MNRPFADVFRCGRGEISGIGLRDVKR